MNFGKSRATNQKKQNVKVRFSDVAGAEEEKQELVEVVEFLKTHVNLQRLVLVFLQGYFLRALQGQVNPSCQSRCR